MGKHILLCEDEPGILDVTKRTLEAHGHTVDATETADQAIELHNVSKKMERPYDVFITDVDMPAHTGLYGASYVRNEGFEGRIIVFTNLERERIFESVVAVKGQYVLKGENINRIAAIVDGALPTHRDSPDNNSYLDGTQ